MKQYKVGTCGYYDTENTIANGQTVRTCSITNEIRNNIGESNVKALSYHTWRKSPCSLLFHFLKLEKESERLLLFPDANAIKVLIPLALMFKKLFRTKVYYNVIGGWLPEYLKKSKYMQRCLKRLDGIFVQTAVLKDALVSFGIREVYVFPNFKNITIYQEDKLLPNHDLPLKICFISRVTEQKGVEEMVQVIKQINQERVKYILDIFGPISVDYTQRFAELEKDFPSYIQYKGAIDPLKTSEVIKDYFLQLFPTKFRTEGFPGSILDSFCAGVPVLVSRWNSYANVIDEGINGISFAFDDFKDMMQKLEEIYESPQIVVSMKRNCIDKANQYKPEKVIQIMLNILFGDEI